MLTSEQCPACTTSAFVGQKPGGLFYIVTLLYIKGDQCVTLLQLSEIIIMTPSSLIMIILLAIFSYAQFTPSWMNVCIQIFCPVGFNVDCLCLNVLPITSCFRVFSEYCHLKDLTTELNLVGAHCICEYHAGDTLTMFSILKSLRNVYQTCDNTFYNYGNW